MIVIVILLILIVSSELAPFCADGCVVNLIYDSAMYSELHREKDQFCFISHRDKTERMLLEITVDELQGKDAVWIVPVPGTADSIHLDIIKDFPYLPGRDISSHRSSIPFYMLYPYLTPFMAVGLATSTGSGIRVETAVEKYGIRSEIVSADSVESLATHISEENHTLPDEVQNVLKQYIGKNYCFIVSWISDHKKYLQEKDEKHWSKNSTGIYVRFQSPDIFYPLIPTSVYGDTVVPATIYAVGLQTPKNPPPGTTSEFYYADLANFNELLRPMLPQFEKHPYSPGFETLFSEIIYDKGFSLHNLFYTKIIISAPSHTFSNDLTLVPISHFKDSIIRLAVADTGRAVILLTLLCSLTASAAASFFLRRSGKISLLKSVIPGLAGVVYFPAYCTACMRIDASSEENRNKAKNYLLSLPKLLAAGYGIICIFAIATALPEGIDKVNEQLIFGVLLFTITAFILLFVLMIQFFVKHQKGLALQVTLYTEIYFLLVYGVSHLLPFLF